jgi:peroxiredoxin
LAGFQENKQEIEALGGKIVAGSIDPLDKAKETATQLSLSYPLGYGMTRADADRLGAWWEERRGIIQPSGFIVGEDGKVKTSAYSSGPIGRMEPGDVVKVLEFYEKQAKK